jgi:ribosome-associated protein
MLIEPVETSGRHVAFRGPALKLFERRRSERQARARRGTIRPNSLYKSRLDAHFPRMTSPDTAERPSRALAQRIARLCDEFKAVDIVVLDLKAVTDMTDFFVIASGTSDTHVRAVAERVMESTKKEGMPVHHVEGLQQGRWVLLDYVDVVVHVFHPALRSFYQLERLWSDASVVSIAPEGANA